MSQQQAICGETVAKHIAQFHCGTHDDDYRLYVRLRAKLFVKVERGQRSPCFPIWSKFPAFSGSVLPESCSKSIEVRCQQLMEDGWLDTPTFEEFLVWAKGQRNKSAFWIDGWVLRRD